MKLAEAERRFLLSAGLLSLLCVGLFIVRAMLTDTNRYWFITENLLLAWLSLIFVWLLANELRHRRWLSPLNITLTVLWLLFLPNAWYVLTDYIHVRPTYEISLLFDIVLFSSLVFAGFTLGFASLYMMHIQLLKRLAARPAHLIIGGVILLSSFAIYLGRELRWNTWDIVANPSGIILNVSDRLIDPLGHIRALNVTALLFVLLGVMYLALWLFLPPRKKGKLS